MRRFPLCGAVALAVLASASPAPADEGMWLINQVADLDGNRLKAMGFELAPSDLWDAKSSTGLASAACSIGGCSASFVSPDGLIATNHHCAYRAIQLNSTAEDDYLARGFLANGRADERPARGYRVYVFRGYDDVTARMRGAFEKIADPLARTRARERAEKELVAGCEKNGLRCKVAAMDGGLQYLLFRTLELRDVRLVYAPPNDVGDFGGEIDNWMWPRHTGDYSFLRAYVGPDGKPADYSRDNQPYRPERWLKPASAPLGPGDFTFILGYPGRTMRHRVALSVEEDLSWAYPARIALFKDLIAILEAEQKRGREIEIKLGPALQGYYNSLKKTEGMLDGLKRSGLLAERRAAEADLLAWIAADPARQARYGEVLPRLEQRIVASRAGRERKLVLGQITGRGGSLLAAAVSIERWSDERAKPDLERRAGYQDRDRRDLKVRLERMQRDLDLQADRRLLRYLLGRAAALPAQSRIAAVDEALTATGKTGDSAIESFLEELYGGSRLGDRDWRLALLDLSHADLLARGDAMIAFARALRRDGDAREQEEDREAGDMVMLEPPFHAAFREMHGGLTYPDANGTLRFSYGTVAGYRARDAVRFEPFTTLAGVIEKHTGAEPFRVPERLLEAAARPASARYLDPRLNDVPACFLTSNDITGGNSGSPILNGRGELVGLAFDGNWEAITNDYRFDPATTRTIGVDLRFILWNMDETDRAHGLMREMAIEPATP